MDFRKFQDLYDRKERDFLLLGTLREWEYHLHSLGVHRMPEDGYQNGFVIWSNAMKDWVRFPEELAERVLVLGLIP